MILGKRVVVVMPAYNAVKTLEQTVEQVDRDIVDDIVLVDDYSQDGTVELATNLGLHTIRHERNLGYGGNQSV